MSDTGQSARPEVGMVGPCQLSSVPTRGKRESYANESKAPLKKSSQKGARSRGTCLDFLLHIGATQPRLRWD